MTDREFWMEVVKNYIASWATTEKLNTPNDMANCAVNAADVALHALHVRDARNLFKAGTK